MELLSSLFSKQKAVRERPDEVVIKLQAALIDLARDGASRAPARRPPSFRRRVLASSLRSARRPFRAARSWPPPHRGLSPARPPARPLAPPLRRPPPAPAPRPAPRRPH